MECRTIWIIHVSLEEHVLEDTYCLFAFNYVLSRLVQKVCRKEITNMKKFCLILFNIELKLIILTTGTWPETFRYNKFWRTLYKPYSHHFIFFPLFTECCHFCHQYFFFLVLKEQGIKIKSLRLSKNIFTMVFSFYFLIQTKMKTHQVILFSE